MVTIPLDCSKHMLQLVKLLMKHHILFLSEFLAEHMGGDAGEKKRGTIVF